MSGYLFNKTEQKGITKNNIRVMQISWERKCFRYRTWNLCSKTRCRSYILQFLFSFLKAKHWRMWDTTRRTGKDSGIWQRNCKNHDFTIHDATFEMMYLGQSDNGLGTTLFNKLKQLKKEPIKKTLGERCLVTSFPNFAVHIGLSPIEQGENREDFHYRFNLLRSCILRPFVLNKK